MDASTKRPVGVTIAAVLYSCGGIALLLGVLDPVFHEDSRSVATASLLIDLGFQAVIALTAGVGMWTRRKWGWWFGAFYLCYSVAMGLAVVLQLVLGTPNGVPGPYGAAVIRIVVSLVLLSYFFRGNVAQFFELAPSRRWKRLGLLLIAAIVTSLALAWVSMRVGPRG